MKRVLITGGARGIGLALCKIFNENNYKVICLDKNYDDVEKIEGVIYYQCDVSSKNDVDNVIDKLEKIDILINNAAIQYIKPFLKTDYEDFYNVVNVNLIGNFNVTRACATKMNGGQIINVGSIHSSVPRINKIAYDATKAAINIMTKELALELHDKAIRVNCVEFGAVDTPMNKDTFEKNRKEVEDSVLMKHIFESKEIAKVIYNFTLDDFKYMNGSVIVYDAGRSIK